MCRTVILSRRNQAKTPSPCEARPVSGRQSVAPVLSGRKMSRRTTSKGKSCQLGNTVAGRKT